MDESKDEGDEKKKKGRIQRDPFPLPVEYDPSSVATCGAVCRPVILDSCELIF